MLVNGVRLPISYIQHPKLLGPGEIPFTGNIPVVRVDQIEDLRRRYGNIFTWVLHSQQISYRKTK